MLFVVNDSHEPESLYNNGLHGLDVGMDARDDGVSHE